MATMKATAAAKRSLNQLINRMISVEVTDSDAQFSRLVRDERMALQGSAGGATPEDVGRWAREVYAIFRNWGRADRLSSLNELINVIQAEEAGRNAYHSGVSILANPQRELMSLYCAWENGWYAALNSDR